MSADDRKQAGIQHMALIRSQIDVKPNPAPDARGSAGVATGWLADDKYAWVGALMLATMFLLLIVPFTLFSGEVNEFSKQTSSVFYRVLKFSLLMLGPAIMIWRFSLTGRLLRELNVFLLAFMALVLLSLTWSIEPGITAWMSLSVCTIFVVAAAFVMVGWHPRRLQGVVRPVLTGFLVASLIFGLLEPGLGRETGSTFTLAGSWRGVFVQKNGLGFGAMLGTMFWVHAWLAKETRFWRFAMGLGVSVTCLLLSRSSTALYATIFATLFLLLLMKGVYGRRRYIAPLTVLFVALVLFYSLAILKIVPGDSLLQPFVAATGKDMTFTGRTRVWAVVMEHIKLHPMLGTGYAAYWIGPVPRSPSIETMDRYSDYYPSEAHNGYLDVINDLGYVGLACLVGYILVFLRRSLELLRVDYTQAVLYLALLFEELIFNLTDSDWFSFESLGFALTIIVMFALARAALDRRLRAVPAMRPNPLPIPRVAVGGSLPRTQAR
jgi:exopolysaccharide production protein ExoQ